MRIITILLLAITISSCITFNSIKRRTEIPKTNKLTNCEDIQAFFIDPRVKVEEIIWTREDGKASHSISYTRDSISQIFNFNYKKIKSFEDKHDRGFSIKINSNKEIVASYILDGVIVDEVIFRKESYYCKKGVLKVVTSKHVGDVWSDLPNFGFSLTTVDLFFDNNYLYVRRKNLIISLVFYIVPDIYSGGFWSKFPLKNKP